MTPIGILPGSSGRPSTFRLVVAEAPLKGSCHVTPAPETPASALTRSVSCLQNSPVSSGPPVGDLATVIVRTFRGSKPSGTLCSWVSVLTSSPAPTRSTRASATSPMTSRFRVRPERRPPALLLPPSLRDSVSRARETPSAGTRPNSTPVTNETSAVKPSTRPSTRVSVIRVKASGLSETIREVAPSASRLPAAPPARVSIRFSVTSCRARRQREAPSAPPPQPHRDLTLPAHPSCQQQIRHVRACDEQHDAYHAEEEQQREPQVPHQPFAQRHDSDAQVLVVFAESLGEARRDHVRLRLRLLNGRAVLEPADDPPPAIAAPDHDRALAGLLGVAC